MAQSKKNTTSGNGFTIAASIVYSLLLVLVGVLIWYSLHPAVEDDTRRAVEYDSQVSEALVRAGATDQDIVAQSREEKSSDRARWIEYYKEVLVPLPKDQAALSLALTMAARRAGLQTAESNRNDTVILAVSFHKRILYRILITPRHPAKTAGKSAVNAKKKVAIVIDDVGGGKDVASFLDLSIPLTFAIMPHERHARDIARRLTELKIPYILHLPMQPEGFPSVDPGKAALLLSMDEPALRKKFDDDFRAVPGVAGVSNHMGSAFSADAVRMRLLLSLVKAQGVFYFDSYTTPKSAAAGVQKALGMPRLRNDLFLDVEDTPAAMHAQLEKLRAHVNRRGTGIAIGHIQKKHLVAALREIIPEFQKDGIEFVYLTDLAAAIHP